MTVLKRILVTGGIVVAVTVAYFWGYEIVEKGEAYVPEITEGIKPPDLGTEGKKSLNEATGYEIRKIKGFGETISKRIKEYREEMGGFKGMEDLKGVPLIGDKRMEMLRKHFSI